MINVFFRPEQTANVDVFSPSPRKPKLVVEAWLKEFPGQIKINSFEPVTVDQLCLAHSRDYVEGVLSCRLPNGFGTKDKVVAESLPYTSGSYLAAAKFALDNGVAISPTSGAHHAGGSFGGGYCSYNFLMVTAVELLTTGKVKKAGILDLDMHWGNGTHDIINILNLRDKVLHFSGGDKYHDPIQADRFLERLPTIIKSMYNQGCGIILGQLGADPHINDPLGGWLTTDQMYQRDLIVFETCKELAIPLVANLAGGYQEPVSKVVQLHVNMMQACLTVHETMEV